MFIQSETNDASFDDLLSQEGSLSWFFLLEDAYIMADRVEVFLPITKVPEATTFTATAYYRTRSAQAAATPTTIHYQVSCLTTKTVLTDWTSVSPATNNDIPITSTMNAIQQDVNKTERRQIIVKADAGLSTQAIGNATWVVENLYGIGGGV